MGGPRTDFGRLWVALVYQPVCAIAPMSLRPSCRLARSRSGGAAEDPRAASLAGWPTRDYCRDVIRG